MKSRSGLFMLSVVVTMLVLAACGSAAPATEIPAVAAPPDQVGKEPLYPSNAPAQAAAPVERSAMEGAAEDLAPTPMPTAAAFEITNPSGDLTVIERSNRMIVKNADVRLMVKDTDVAIDRATQ